MNFNNYIWKKKYLIFTYPTTSYMYLCMYIFQIDMSYGDAIWCKGFVIVELIHTPTNLSWVPRVFISDPIQSNPFQYNPIYLIFWPSRKPSYTNIEHFTEYKRLTS